jgi:hypothetical protein
MTHPLKIACFISPHGFGHAARASAVLAAIHRANPAAEFELFALTPPWFFANSLPAPFHYHALRTDIGLVQHNSLRENLPATIEALGQMLPFDPALIDQLAGQITAAGCRLVLCDIVPLGLAVARAAGLPSVLVENFTWDWIYEGYPAYQADLQPYIDYLAEAFAAATYHIQTEPACAPRPVDLTTAPVSRQIRQSAAEVRRQLDIPQEAKVMMMTMGGGDWDYTFLAELARHPAVYFLLAGDQPGLTGGGNLRALPANSPIFHPDLINAADVVIGKVGYSTLAEIYQAGAVFGYLARPEFRESPWLVGYVRANMPGLELTEAEFIDGSWLRRLPDLLALPRAARPARNGADQIARFVLAVLG